MKMYNIVGKRFSSGLLQERMRAIVPGKVQEFKEIKKTYGAKKIGEITVDQVLGGMRGMPGLFYETSKLDAQKGIMYRQHNLFDLCETLKYKGSKEPLPEALIWYLFTGEIPNESQIESTIKEITEIISQTKCFFSTINSKIGCMHNCV